MVTALGSCVKWPYDLHTLLEAFVREVERNSSKCGEHEGNYKGSRRELRLPPFGPKGTSETLGARVAEKGKRRKQKNTEEEREKGGEREREGKQEWRGDGQSHSSHGAIAIP
jgi:hypothetical protein